VYGYRSLHNKQKKNIVKLGEIGKSILLNYVDTSPELDPFELPITLIKSKNEKKGKRTTVKIGSRGRAITGIFPFIADKKQGNKFQLYGDYYVSPERNDSWHLVEQPIHRVE
jgi:hypothetical protein